MANTEIFNIATWNFLSGDRSVEDILKDKRISGITIRGGIGTVLPTIAGIRDLGELGWKEKVEASVYVPFNAVSSHNPDLLLNIREDKFYETILSQSYGIEINKSYRHHPEQLIIVMNMTEENEIAKKISPHVLKVLQEVKDEKFIFISSRKEKILPEFRKYVLNAWSAIYWEGFNAFFSTHVEEAIKEANPKKIMVLGAGYDHVFYTAIGAVDYFIIEDSRYRDPESLQLWDLMELGKKVSVISYPENSITHNITIKDMVSRHLTETLGVKSIMEDHEYTKVPNHKIMIDVM